MNNSNLSVESDCEMDEIVITDNDTGRSFVVSKKQVATSKGGHDVIMFRTDSPGICIEIPVEKEAAQEIANAIEYLL